MPAGPSVSAGLGGSAPRTSVSSHDIVASDPHIAGLGQVDPAAPATYRWELIGFDRGDVDARLAREITSAVDHLVRTYPIPLRGIEIRDGSPHPELERSSNLPVPDRSADDAAAWIVLDRAALGRPPRPRARWRSPRRRPDRALYTAVVREYAHTLDRAGGFRAREQAWQQILPLSLRSGPSTFSPLNPEQALIDGFTEVVLRGKRAGTIAHVLHDALVNAATWPPPATATAAFAVPAAEVQYLLPPDPLPPAPSNQRK